MINYGNGNGKYSLWTASCEIRYNGILEEFAECGKTKQEAHDNLLESVAKIKEEIVPILDNILQMKCE